jgi:hypothetical protein
MCSMKAPTNSSIGAMSELGKVCGTCRFFDAGDSERIGICIIARANVEKALEESGGMVTPKTFEAMYSARSGVCDEWEPRTHKRNDEIDALYTRLKKVRSHIKRRALADYEEFRKTQIHPIRYCSGAGLPGSSNT